MLILGGDTGREGQADAAVGGIAPAADGSTVLSEPPEGKEPIVGAHVTATGDPPL